MLGAAPAYADKIDDAAKKLSEASYPFLKEIDWTSDVYGTRSPPPRASERSANPIGLPHSIQSRCVA